MLAMLPLGTAMIELSRVWMRVVRKPTSATDPAMLSTSIQSPIWKGRSTKIMAEPIRFLTVSCAARARASPPIDTPAIRAVMLTSSRRKTCKIANRKITTCKVRLMMGIN